MGFSVTVEELLTCSGSSRFAKEMAALSPFDDRHHAISAARDVWFNKVDVNGWLESFAAHPAIGETKMGISQRSKDEQSTAMLTSSDSLMQELLDWNARYKEKFGFIFLICASGRSMTDILAELKKRYPNRPIVEFEIAAQEDLKIIELRLTKLWKDKTAMSCVEIGQSPTTPVKSREDRIGVLGAHLTALPMDPSNKASSVSGSTTRTRPPITTHVLDVSRGSPALGIEVHLEMWKGISGCSPSFNGRDSGEWVFQGSSVTNSDGRSGPLMDMVDQVLPGFYRISFNTSRYIPSGFFPYVSIAFEIKESQRMEHFHVPLLLSPFSFTTYRGS